jgi:hypothetical protein
VHVDTARLVGGYAALLVAVACSKLQNVGGVKQCIPRPQTSLLAYYQM